MRLRKYKVSHNAKKSLLASCALFILPLFASNMAFAQNEDERMASIPADNIAQAAPRVTLNETDKIKLRAAVNSSVRVEINRDKYRHPEQTIEFFGIKPDATVIEIWPGQGWYTSILGPYLKSGGGHLVAANFDTATTNSDLVQKVVDSFRDKFSSHPEVYGDVQIVPFGPRSGAMVPDGTADAVLTFRNIHNWMAQGWSDKAFDDFYRALKPGGILGIEEHRADEDTPQDPMAADGYVRQDYVISLAKDAGFELVDASEINANAKDTKDHPFGVWTLPPVLRTAPMGQAPNPKFDSNRYNAIGESDRMTLLFRKPLKVDKPPVMAEKSGPIPIPVFFGDKKPKKGKADTKTALAKNPTIASLNPFDKKPQETTVTPNTVVSSPVIEKTETKAVALNEAAKSEEAKAKAVILTKPPSWDKGAPKQETVKADANVKAPIVTEPPKETAIVKTEADVEKTIVDTAKTTNETPVNNTTVNTTEVKPEIPVLPENIITNDKPAEITKEAKPTETKADLTNPAKVEAPAVHKKPETKAPAKASAKAKTDTKEKATKTEPASKNATKDTKGKITKKVDSKEDAKTTSKGAKATNNKTSSKTSAKNTDKADVKSKTSSKTGTKTTKPEEKTTKTGSKATSKSGTKADSKTTDKKTNSKTASKPAVSSEKKPASKTDTKAKTTAKPATKTSTKSKNANVPDWSAPKKHK